MSAALVVPGTRVNRSFSVPGTCGRAEENYYRAGSLQHVFHFLVSVALPVAKWSS